jgi:hypothetical protein
MGLVNLGAAACEEGDFARASACYREALAIERRLGSKSEISISLDGLSAVAAGRKAWERAARLAGAAEALRAAISYERLPVDVAARERTLALVREALGEAAFETAFAEGRRMSLDEALAVALEG